MEGENTAQYFLQSQRPGFRRWLERDLPFANALWGDREVTRFITAGGCFSDEQIEDLLHKYIAMQRDYGVQYWPIFLRKSGEHLGCCGLRPYDEANRVYEIGVHIRSAWWRQGLAEEAARAAIEYAFGTLRARGLFAGHHPNNVASQLLLRKLGFRYTHHEFYAATGLEHPSYILTPNPGLS